MLPPSLIFQEHLDERRHGAGGGPASARVTPNERRVEQIGMERAARVGLDDARAVAAAGVDSAEMPEAEVDTTRVSVARKV